MLFSNKTTTSSLFAASPSVTVPAANPFSRPNPPSKPSVGLWSASVQTSNPTKPGLFSSQTSYQGSSQSVMSNQGVGSNQSLFSNSGLFKSSNNGNYGLFRPQPPEKPALGFLQGSSNRQAPGLMSQNANYNSNPLFSSSIGTGPKTSQQNSGFSNTLFPNQPKQGTTVGLFNTKPNNIGTQKPAPPANGLFNQPTTNFSLFSPALTTSQTNPAKPSSSLLFSQNTTPNMPKTNPTNAFPAQPTKSSVFSNILNSSSTQNTASITSLWNNPNNKKVPQQPSNVFWQKQSSAVSNTSSFASIFNRPQPPTQQQGQSTLFKPSAPLFPFGSQTNTSSTQLFKPLNASTGTTNSKNGLPFSWTAPSRPATQLFSKPKSSIFNNGNQTVPQWSSSSGVTIPQTNYGTQVGSGLFNSSASTSKPNTDADFFQKLQDRVSYKDSKENFCSYEDLSYNIFAESHSRRSYKTFEDCLTRNYNSIKTQRNYAEEEEEEIAYESLKTKKELTALHYSRDLVRMLKSQDNRKQSDEIKEKQKKEADMILYIMFLEEGNENERTFAIDVSGDNICLDLKKSILSLVYGNEKVDPNHFRLHRNGQLLDETKTLDELNINSFEYLVLEQTENNHYSVSAKKEEKVELITKKLVHPSLLPKVPECYHIEPSFQVLSNMTEEELSRVERFCISNKEARVQFEEPVDLRGLDLGQIVRLEHKAVEVYPEDGIVPLPEVGKGLNKAATIEFYNWNLPQKYGANLEKYITKLNEWAVSTNAKFKSYDIKKETVVITVENFGKYDD